MITTNKNFLLQRCEERRYILEEIAECIIDKQGDLWTIDENSPHYPKIKQSHPYDKDDPNGPGTILSNMLSIIGIKSTENCSCKKHAKAMNERGYKWCTKNIDLIIGWLKIEAEKRKLPFIEYPAKLIVNRAIRISKKYYDSIR